MGLQGWLVPWPCPDGCWPRVSEQPAHCARTLPPSVVTAAGPWAMYHYRHPKQGSEGIMLQRWLAALFTPRVPACRPLVHLVTVTPAFPVHAHFTARLSTLTLLCL